MPRVTPITTKEQVASEHRPIFDAVAEGRGSVRGPFSIMMYSPEMCSRVLNTSNFLRFQSSVKPKEGELAIIATAREKDCPFVWAAHVTLARKAGAREEAIAVVRDGMPAGSRSTSARSSPCPAARTTAGAGVFDARRIARRALGRGANRRHRPLRDDRPAERLRDDAGSRREQLPVCEGAKSLRGSG